MSLIRPSTKTFPVWPLPSVPLTTTTTHFFTQHTNKSGLPRSAPSTPSSSQPLKIYTKKLRKPQKNTRLTALVKLARHKSPSRLHFQGSDRLCCLSLSPLSRTIIPSFLTSCISSTSRHLLQGNFSATAANSPIPTITSPKSQQLTVQPQFYQHVDRSTELCLPGSRRAR